MSPTPEILSYDRPVILVGSADLDFNQLEELVSRGFALIAADGGANALMDREVFPEAIIGDFDSLDPDKCQGKKIKLVKLEEQNSTDFEKCLYSVDAPVFLALGFTGKRFDHSLAALHVMTKFHREKKVILLSGSDVSFVQCGELTWPLSAHQQISIFPLATISFARSKGLKFPLDGLTFEIGSQIGTSNQAKDNIVTILPANQSLETPYLVTLPNSALMNILEK